MTHLRFINQFSKRKIIDAIEKVLPHWYVMRIAYRLGEIELDALSRRKAEAADRMNACAAEMKDHPGDITLVERFHKEITAWEDACVAYDRLSNQMNNLQGQGVPE